MLIKSRYQPAKPLTPFISCKSLTKGKQVGIFHVI